MTEAPYVLAVKLRTDKGIAYRECIITPGYTTEADIPKMFQVRDGMDVEVLATRFIRHLKGE